MNRNPLNLQLSRNELPATWSSPADFPLGSPHSRAAARALLQAKVPSLSLSAQYDEDAYEIYRAVCLHFDATMDPTYHELEPMAIYIKGREVYERRHGQTIPFHLDDHAKRSTDASREFEIAFRREPAAGDMLRCYHVGIMHNPELIAAGLSRFFGAWQRQLPQVICPLKLKDNCLYKRLESGKWDEDVTVQSQTKWWGVECDVFGRTSGEWAYGTTPHLWQEPDPRPLDRMPTIGGVVFFGIVDGKHKCRPASPKELQQPETDELFQEILSGKER